MIAGKFFLKWYNSWELPSHVFRVASTYLLAGMEFCLLLVVSRKISLWSRKNSTNSTFTMSGSMLTNKHLTAVLAFHIVIPFGCRHLQKMEDLACNRVKFKKKWYLRKWEIPNIPKNWKTFILLWIVQNTWKWFHVVIPYIEQLMSMWKKIRMQLNLFSDAYEKVTNRNWIIFR